MLPLLPFAAARPMSRLLERFLKLIRENEERWPMQLQCVLIVVLMVSLATQIPPLLQRSDGAEGSWLGKRIIIKRAGIKFYKDDRPDAKELGELRDFDYVILEVSREMVKVQQDADLGWIAKGDVVLVEEAIGYFTRCIREKSRDASAYGRRGWAWHLKKQGDIALQELDQAIIFEPTNATYLVYRGKVYHSLGEAYPEDYDKAIKDFYGAQDIDHNNARAYRSIGLTQYMKKKYDWAIGDFVDALRLNPRDPETYLLKGQTHLELKQFDDAIFDFKEAIKLDENLALAYSEWGRALFMWGRLLSQKRYDLASEKYTEAIGRYCEAIWRFRKKWEAPEFKDDLRPEYAKALYGLGRLRYTWNNANNANRDFEPAIFDYGLAMEIDKSLAPAYSDRGLANYSQAREFMGAVAKSYYTNAKSDYEQAIKLADKEFIKPQDKKQNAHMRLALLRADRSSGLFDADDAVKQALLACDLTRFEKREALEILAVTYAARGELYRTFLWLGQATKHPQYDADQAKLVNDLLWSHVGSLP
jgi:tetratricopeptide (TPR) repeat protein